MPVYRKHGKPEYTYDFQLRGRRFSGPTGTSNKRQAEQILKEKKVEAREKLKAAALFTANGPMTLEIAASRYWTEVGQHLANADDCYRYLGWLISHFGKHVTLDRITDSMVAAMVATRRGEIARKKPGKSPSPATVNRSSTVALRALMLCAKKAWKVPVADVDWKQHLLKEREERVREASRDEEGRILGAMRDDYAAAVRFAFLTGCRRMEIVNLTWSRVDLSGRTITVVGKGDKTRVIPMTNAAYELLKAEIGKHPIAVFTYVVQATRKHLGLVRGTYLPITKEGFKTAWRRYKKYAAVEDFRFHDTRHTAATRTLRTGNLKVVKQMLGHTDIATTSKYAHAMLDDVRAAMEAANHTENHTGTQVSGGNQLNNEKKSA